MENMTRDGEYADTSLPVARTAIGLLLCGAAAFIVSWPYVFILNQVAVVFLVDILAAVGLGHFMGAVAKVAMRRLKIHSAASAVVLGLGGGFLGVWFAWLVYIFIWSGYSFSSYIYHAINPLSLIGAMEFVAENPYWSFSKGSAEPAIFYYAIWLVEFVAVAVIAMKSSRAFVEENARCEGCGEWIAQTGDSIQLSLSGKAEVTERLAAGDVSALAELPLYDPGSGEPAWIEVKGYACPTCRDRESLVSASVVHFNQKASSDTPQKVERPIFRFRPVSVELEERIFESSREEAIPAPVAAPEEALAEDAVAEPERLDTTGERA